MADQHTPTRTSASTPKHTTKQTGDGGSLGDVIATVKEYARQETLGPLKGAARWLAFGAAAAIMLGIGTSLLVLALLRLVQHEFAPTFAGRWMSLLPYVISLVASVVVIGLAISRIAKSSLQKNPE